MNDQRITAADLAAVEEQEWQRKRGMGIGGSEVGALLGVDQYATPYSLWERKTGRADAFEGNDYTKAGHLMEPVIVQWFMEQTGLKCTEVGHLVSPSYNWRRVTPDRLVGDDGLMDAKNSRFEISPDDIREGRNMKWYFQIIWGLGIWNELHPEAPRTKGYIVWLGAGYQFQYLQFEYEQEVYDMMCETVDAFWNDYVLADVAPPPITREDILRAIGKVIPQAKEATPEIKEFFEQLVMAKQAVKEAQSIVDEMKEAIQLYLLENDTLTVDGRVALTWKEQSAKRLDTKAIQAELPEIVQKYTKESTTRVLRIK